MISYVKIKGAPKIIIENQNPVYFPTYKILRLSQRLSPSGTGELFSVYMRSTGPLTDSNVNQSSLLDS